MLFEHGMEIGPSKTERADAGSPDFLEVNPGP
jgi:hypothetical protein